jgi:hypothetical protein
MVHHAATSALADGVRRELGRVGDRLRILGPRWSQREVPPPEADRVRAVLQLFADLAADSSGEPRRAVPQLALHALADQLLVLGHDVLVAADPQALDAVHGALLELRRTL